MVAVACAIIVACGQRNQLHHEIQPTSGGEGIGIDHGTIDVNSLPTVETTIEHERFTAAMPQGWQLVQTNNDGVNLLKGTIDEDVMKALRKKERTQNALIDAVKANLGVRR